MSKERTILAGLLVAALTVVVLAMLRLPAAPSPQHDLSPRPPTVPPPSATPPPTPTATLPGAPLETLYLDFTPDGWSRILAKREEALRRGILIVGNKDYVPVMVRLGDRQFRAEARLKGDWIDHLFYDKWSFRIHLIDDGAVFGMRRFSLQDPGRRSYLNEWLFLQNLRREEVLAVRYHFVHLVLNGEDKGIYAVEESFAKELLESQQRREGPIVRWDEDLVWAYRALYDDQLIPRGVNDFHMLDLFQSSKVAADPQLSAEARTAEGMLRAVVEGERPASDVFDVETMGRFLALSDLWCAPHGLIWHNLRFYANPVTARLEPIAYDSDVFDCDLEQAGLSQDHFYGDPRLQRAYLRAAWTISDPAYLDRLREALEPAYLRLREALLPEFGAEPLAPPWDELRHRQQLLREVLQPYRTVYAYTVQPRPDVPVETETVSLTVANLLPYPLVLEGVEIDGHHYPLERGWLIPTDQPQAAFIADGELILDPLPEEAAHLPALTLRLPRERLPDGAKLRVITRLWGLEEEHRDPVVHDYPAPLPEGPRPARPTLEEALRRYPFLERGPDTTALVVRPGDWSVQGDLVLPAGCGLVAGPGTTLRFEEGAILFGDAPLRLEGSADAPVRLLPRKDRWGGVIVLHAEAPSFWHHVLVSATTGITRGGWLVSGGTTFERSPVRMSDCTFLHSRAEDTLNIVRSRFAITRTEFGWSASDALDVDFGEGEVGRSSFHDIGGDGIDLSGSRVTVEAVRMQRIADKAVSAGEITRVTVRHSLLAESNFGVVSKDLSQAEVIDTEIVHPRIAALAAYVKKPTYGPATLTADGIRFVETDEAHRTLVQAGCTLRLEGERIPGRAIDVGALYGP